MPNPGGYVFKAGDLKAIDLVKVAVVEPMPRRLEHHFDLVEIMGPAKNWIPFAGKINNNGKGMTVPPRIRRNLMGSFVSVWSAPPLL